MTWFKPGDKVTSPLLVGEWEYRYLNPEGTLARVMNRDANVWVSPSDLTLVAPPLPPEPPVGTLGFVDGRPVYRYTDGWWTYMPGSPAGNWSEIADRFVPAVPKPTVDQMADALRTMGALDE